MRTIDDIVNALSIEERKLHEELIKECREREAEAIQDGKKLRQDLERLTNIFKKIQIDIDSLHTISFQLDVQREILEDNSISIDLRMIPDDWFFHA